MSRACENKSKILVNDLKKVGFDTVKGGSFNLCSDCQQKYGMKPIFKDEKQCVFGCN